MYLTMLYITCVLLTLQVNAQRFHGGSTRKYHHPKELQFDVQDNIQGKYEQSNVQHNFQPNQQQQGVQLNINQQDVLQKVRKEQKKNVNQYVKSDIISNMEDVKMSLKQDGDQKSEPCTPGSKRACFHRYFCYQRKEVTCKREDDSLPPYLIS